MNQSIKENILNDFFQKKPNSFSVLYDKNDTLVMEHVKHPEYLLKLSNKTSVSSQIQLGILSSLPSSGNFASRINHTETYNHNGHLKTLEIIDKMQGKPKQQYTENEIVKVIRALKRLHVKLNQDTSEYLEVLPSIEVLFTSLTSHISNTPLKLIADMIKNDEAYENLVNEERQYITIADLVYENILFEYDDINFIDLDPLILGPERLQLAILLTSNILGQTKQFEYLSMSVIDKYYRIWGYDKVSREDLIALSIFPFLILLMKQVDFNAIPEDRNSLYFRLKAILLFIVAELKGAINQYP